MAGGDGKTRDKPEEDELEGGEQQQDEQTENSTPE